MERQQENVGQENMDGEDLKPSADDRNDDRGHLKTSWVERRMKAVFSWVFGLNDYFDQNSWAFRLS
jgi:hypothetical protein